MLQSDSFQIASETAWEDLGEGIQRQIFGHDDNIMLVKVKFEKDAIGQLHHHPHVQVSYVASGIFETSIAGQVKVLKQGDGFYVKPNTVHGVVCKEAGMLIDVFSPHREDFLP